MLRIITGQVPLPGNFDAAHIKQIHQETFKDVYDWAGQTRANGPDEPFQGRKQATFRGQKDIMRYGS
jgi:cell filamentation protein